MWKSIMGVDINVFSEAIKAVWIKLVDISGSRCLSSAKPFIMRTIWPCGGLVGEKCIYFAWLCWRGRQPESCWNYKKVLFPLSKLSRVMACKIAYRSNSSRSLGSLSGVKTDALPLESTRTTPRWPLRSKWASGPKDYTRPHQMSTNEAWGMATADPRKQGWWAEGCWDSGASYPRRTRSLPNIP